MNGYNPASVSRDWRCYTSCEMFYIVCSLHRSQTVEPVFRVRVTKTYIDILGLSVRPRALCINVPPEEATGRIMIKNSHGENVFQSYVLIGDI